jgi:SpoVK/Ycf46/Vps4 family AAA+-type ATPase
MVRLTRGTRQQLVERAVHAARMRDQESPAAQQRLKIEDFAMALRGFTPAALKGVVLHSPSNTKWGDVGGLKPVKQKLVQVEAMIRQMLNG